MELVPPFPERDFSTAIVKAFCFLQAALRWVLRLEGEGSVLFSSQTIWTEQGFLQWFLEVGGLGEVGLVVMRG